MINLYAQQIREISVDDLQNQMRRRERGYVIVDARELTEYYKGHIPGACSLYDGEMNAIARNLDKNANIIVYGPGQAQESPKMESRLEGDAAMKLMQLGFKNVTVLKGGLMSWSNKGNRLDRSEPESIKPAKTTIMSDTVHGVDDISMG
ncbi:rhodanese-like domain-containing protein [Methanocella sp. MCL-LM]|uniref:rhodanese-like domain-containing protein n=1 Tax=Methanocella sp. MCL-LM TaxID=3412035 RepID=UPI003C729537